MEILQARILEWVAMPSSRGSFQPRDQTQVSHFAGRFLTIWATRDIFRQLPIYLFLSRTSLLHEKKKKKLANREPFLIQFSKHLKQSFEKFTLWTSAKSLQSCLTLCDSMDYSLPGFSVHEILQARILEWVVMPLSRGSSWPRDWTSVSWIGGRFFTTEPLGKPNIVIKVNA